MKSRLVSKPWTPVFANDLDAFIPEVWAQESLAILENNLVAAQLVHRDFENEIAMYGDVVNTRQPANFTSKRKLDTDDVTVQDATATNVAVKLNQHHHVSFLIRDGEQSKGFINLRNEYLVPALQAIAQALDQSILVQAYQFLTNVVGKLGTDITAATLVSAREKMTTNKVPFTGRNFVMTPNQEGALLAVAAFTEADKTADGGTAIREANLGRRMGFDLYTSQNAPSIATGNTVVTGAINNGNIAAGSTVLTIDGHSETLVAGSWCTIAGDMIPQRITAVSGTPTTQITISPGLASAVVNDAVVTVYTPGTNSTTRAADYAKEFDMTGFTVAPKSGQLVAFGTAAYLYGTIGTPTTIAMWLDRPLDAQVASTTKVAIGPKGEYGFAFHKNALALVTRPLALPVSTAALSYVANFKGLSVRVTITYDGTKQGHLVTVDLLCGIKILDTNLGCVVLG